MTHAHERTSGVTPTPRQAPAMAASYRATPSRPRGASGSAS